MKLYTRTGDDGTTGLIGGSRTPKDDLQIDCYGTVDELNATIGVVRVTSDPWLSVLLEPVQNELFVIGSHLALADGQKPEDWKLPKLSAASIKRLEDEIDRAEEELPKLKNFVIPTGCESAAHLHVARTVCRRAERLIVTWSRERRLNLQMIEYLNRLSDWLFVHARLANHRAGIDDVLWKR
ncbi:MAG: cob(I)yrinic acid a,c-diamide adenosyltransferase [Tepidisphaeraceae bacterium]